MEKKKPTFLLKDIKKLIREGCWIATTTAIKEAHGLNINRDGIMV